MSVCAITTLGPLRKAVGKVLSVDVQESCMYKFEFTASSRPGPYEDSVKYESPHQLIFQYDEKCFVFLLFEFLSLSYPRLSRVSPQALSFIPRC